MFKWFLKLLNNILLQKYNVSIVSMRFEYDLKIETTTELSLSIIVKQKTKYLKQRNWYKIEKQNILIYAKCMEDGFHTKLFV